MSTEIESAALHLYHVCRPKQGLVDVAAFERVLLTTMDRDVVQVASRPAPPRPPVLRTMQRSAPRVALRPLRGAARAGAGA
jgi:hypothetical protein